MKMRILMTLCAGLLPAAANASLLITEIVDATLPSGLPKFVEIKNVSDDAIDLSGFSIGNINNGGPTMAFDAFVLSGILPAGDVHVISYESGDAPGDSTFFDTYGFDADELGLGSFINGDDVVVLFSGAALAGDDASGSNVVDIYGRVGEGFGADWGYTDGFSFRNPDVMTPNPTFDISEWTVGGIDSLQTGDDTEELALILANTTPGTHNMIPEPGTVALALLSIASAGALSMRSRLG